MDIGQYVKKCAVVMVLGAAIAGSVCLPMGKRADAAETAVSKDALVVRYALDDTQTAQGSKLKASRWDSASQAFVDAPDADATVQNTVQNKATGAVSSVAGKDGSALSFTGSAHARANFHLPADATGMTISLWVKNITTYWASLIEFWDGEHGGRLGKGTMQGNGGRRNEGDAWNQNCAAHAGDVHAAVAGGGWDSFVVTHNNTNNDNGGAYVDNMKQDTWYQVTYVVTGSEMKAYRDGVLKQDFTEGQSKYILGEIMTAAKNQTGGKLGIRLGLDDTGNRADILDELRIYNGAMTDEQVRSLYFEYEPAAELPYSIPAYYATEGLSYPEELLLGGAQEVTDAADGKKSGTTADGVTYTYTPLTGTATPARDETGIELSLTKGELKGSATVKFRRTLDLKAKTLGYRIGEGASVDIPVPQSAAENILVKVPADADLSAVKAGDIAAAHLEGDDSDANYETEFSYSATSHTAIVRIAYKPYTGQDTFYTIVFEKKNTDTFSELTVEGGKSALTLKKADFKNGQASVPVESLSAFELYVTLSLAPGARAEKTDFTAADLEGGKLALRITNENGDETVYNLVPVVLSSDASLSALSAEGYDLKFEAGKTDYSVTVPNGEGAKFFEALTASPKDSKAAIEKRYDKTAGVITVTVTAEDGTQMRYTIAVNELGASDATLKSLKVGGEDVAGFDPSVTDYTVKYAGEVPQVTFEAAEKASASSEEKDGKVIITVTAGDKQTVYTVTLVKMSADTSLKLTLGGKEIAFADGKSEYEMPAGGSIGRLGIQTQVHENATVSYTVKEDEIVFTVTAEDGTTAQYTVHVSAAAVSFGDGTSEDNSPQTGGCGAAVGGAAAGIALVLIAGAAVLVRKKKNR